MTFLLRNPSIFDNDISIQNFLSNGQACIVKGDALVKDDVARSWTEATKNGKSVDYLIFTLGTSPRSLPPIPLESNHQLFYSEKVEHRNSSFSKVAPSTLPTSSQTPSSMSSAPFLTTLNHPESSQFHQQVSRPLPTQSSPSS